MLVMQEDPSKKSDDKDEVSEQQKGDADHEDGEEEAVDMSQEFGGDVVDVPESGEHEDSEGD